MTALRSRTSSLAPKVLRVTRTCTKNTFWQSPKLVYSKETSVPASNNAMPPGAVVCTIIDNNEFNIIQSSCHFFSYITGTGEAVQCGVALYVFVVRTGVHKTVDHTVQTQLHGPINWTAGPSACGGSASVRHRFFFFFFANRPSSQWRDVWIIACLSLDKLLLLENVPLNSCCGGIVTYSTSPLDIISGCMTKKRQRGVEPGLKR